MREGRGRERERPQMTQRRKKTFNMARGPVVHREKNFLQEKKTFTR